MEFINNYLNQFFDEVEPKNFYRNIFPVGELEEKGKQQSGKYNGIAVELLPPQEDNKVNAKRYIITDDLNVIDDLIKSDNFIIMSPISYIGKSRESKNARFLYAIAIDLDGVDTLQNLTDLIHQINEEILPRPTYIVSSGFGVHLYYVFNRPLPCFKNVAKQLTELKRSLTRLIWNQYTTTQSDKPQIQSLFQGFRIVGGITKNGSRTKAYEIGPKVDLNYLNDFVDPKYQVKDIKPKSKLSLAAAAEKYPEWYEDRIINHKRKGTWECNRALYDWWLNRLKREIVEGHRYYGIMCLCIYAKKCGISREELEQDSFGLLDRMEKLTTNEKNHFTREDILAALEMYNDNYITFPIDSIVNLTNLEIQKNKRNYQPQKWHLEDARSKKQNMKRRGQAFKNLEGRPSKESLIIEWQRNNPDGSKIECMLDLGVSKSTVYKYWGKS